MSLGLKEIDPIGIDLGIISIVLKKPQAVTTQRGSLQIIWISMLRVQYVHWKQWVEGPATSMENTTQHWYIKSPLAYLNSEQNLYHSALLSTPLALYRVCNILSEI